MPSKYDKYTVSDDDLKMLDNMLNKREFSGVYCPRRNDKGNCAVCRDVAKLWQLHNDTGTAQSKFSEKARRYGVSAQVYMNVVFPDDPSSVKILQCGTKMASEIVNGMRFMGWRNITNPTDGCTMIVHKSQSNDGYNVYSPSPDMETKGRKLEDMSVLDRLYNLDNIEELREQGADIYDIKSMDKVIRFDILPGWNPKTPGVFIKKVFYHFNIDPSAIETGIDDPVLNGSDNSTEDGGVIGGSTGDDAPMEWDSNPSPDPAIATKQEEEQIVYSLDNPPGCFGGMFFDENDKDADGCNGPQCVNIREECKRRKEKLIAEKKASRASA